MDLAKKNNELTQLLNQKSAELGEKTHELEIEAALEQVRSVAMSMQKPNDLLDVCQIISEQLEAFNVKNIRNVQVAIIDEERRNYANYQYFTAYRKTVFEETGYENNAAAKGMVTEMQKSVNSFFIGSIQGEELKKFKTWRNKDEQFPDPILDKLDVAYYYFYSIGKGGLGLTTYKEISNESLELFKRFHKVFTLAYRRFEDIRQALAQAREAQIEAALERVRSLALGMRKSEEVGNVTDKLFEELNRLTGNIFGCTIAVVDEEKDRMELWRARTKVAVKPFETVSFMDLMRIFKKNMPDWFPVFYKVLTAKEKGLLTEDISGKRRTQTLNSIAEQYNYSKEEKSKLIKNTPENFTAHFLFFNLGYLALMVREKYSDEGLNVVRRFVDLFGFAYTRFLDLQKAEAQARESQIQLGLERVRARAMAMHKSEQLAETAKVLFEQFNLLGKIPDRMSIGIVNEETGNFELWVTDQKGETTDHAFLFRLDETTSVAKIYKAWKKKKASIVVDLSGQELRDWLQFLKNEVKLPINPANIKDRRVHQAAFFSHGFLLLTSHQPVAEEIMKLLVRFAGVFDLTYTRFLDLQKAEAQARESRIQLALERVRARTMAMQSSEELAEVSYLLNKQVVELGIPTRGCAFNIYNEHDSTEWFSNLEGTLPTYKTPRENIFLKYYEAGQRGETLLIEEFGKERIKQHYEYMYSLGLLGNNEDEFMTIARAMPESQIDHVVNFKYGYLLFITLTPAPEAHDIFKRFAKEFEQTYTRFLDLQKVEKQVREAQVEAALERVRNHSIIMQHSNEVKDLSKVFHEQLIALEIPSEFSYIWLPDEQKEEHMFWATWSENKNGMVTTQSKSVIYPLDKSEPYTAACFKAWESDSPVHVTKIPPEETEQFFTTWKDLIQGAKKLKAKNFPDGIYYAESYMKYGCFGINIQRTLNEEEREVLYRFTIEFERAYTRFLDLKKAEKQAREAQIEASLERVRAHAMGLRRSEELNIIISIIFEELNKLGLPVYECSIFIRHGESRDFTCWNLSESARTAKGYHFPFFDHPILDKVLGAIDRKVPLHQFIIDNKELREYCELMFEHTDFKDAPQEYKDSVVSLEKLHVAQAIMNHGFLEVIGTEPLSEELTGVLMRFTRVVDLTYTRYLDIQEAEARAQEARIETALEKVRSRSMGMQKSDELNEVIHVIYDQFVNLGIKVDHTGFIVDYKNRDDMLIWLADQNGPLTKIAIPYFDSPHWNSFMEAKKNEKDFFANQLDFETKNKFYKKLFKFIPDLPEDSKKFYFECPGLAISTVLLDNVGLYIENFSGTPYSDEENNILMRFGKVFQQSYTRFLDLEKAETQTREAQIEASLEKVRGVALSLQKSDEMLQVAQVLYEQLLELGFSNIRNAIIDINNGDGDTFTDYDYSHEMSGTITQMSYHDDPTLEGQFKKMATTTNDFFELVLEGKELEDLKKMRIKNGEAPDPRLDKIDVLTYNLYSFGNGAIGISNFGVLTEEEKSVLGRFNNVFTFAYKRYNDMLQAEQQAREALVELSLERIRAQVTAMRESSELLDIVVTMQTEFNKLGHEAHYFWHMRWLPDKYEKALTNAEGDRIGNVLELPRGFHGLKTMMDWELSDKPSGVFALDPETAADYIDKMIRLGRFQEIDHTAPGPDEVRDMGGLTFIMARTTHGEIGYTLPGEVPNPPKDDVALLVRFAGVFDLAYRRFEDLKSAERQNRETQIDLALERVRAKTMAMQKSEELSEVVANLFYQLDELGIKPYRCNLGIINAKTKYCQLWSTTSDGKVIRLAPNISLTENKHLKKIFSGWKKQGAPFVDIIQGKNRLEWTQYIRKFSDFEEYKPEKINKKKILSEPAILNQVFFKQGFFTIHTLEEMKDEYFDILQRFARVFEQTYTRFLDLQRAEVQASEAVKQASLDRIRGQIASMRTTEDLKQLTPLVWRELKTLEVPFFRCGLFIVDEKKKHVNVYLTTPDGKPLGVLDLDYKANDLARATVASWKKKEVYQTHWNREEFIAWTKEMMQLGQVKVPEKYQGAEEPPESLHLHFIPFAQGMLYVGHEEQLEQEKIDLVKSLAEAFSFAYARYEDFVVLEGAKKRVEKALSDLKATQSQLVHAEKMASLGELTAGIAHEIQNPLNFVNNFSEVSTDLIEELKEELQNGDTEEVKAIATDLLQNLEKITHHGKRASNIVKSMLEHSRAGSDEKQSTDINALADEYLRLAYHGLRAKDKSFNADFKIESDKILPKVNVVAQDIGRVLLNLINNGFFAVSEKAQQSGADYKPELIVTTKKMGDKIEISVKDNGNGIPDKVKEKIFQPFFTTKPTGQGTGLGLSMSYDIIKAHGGEIKVNSQAGEGTEFMIILPNN
ncbi:MAG: hypothetical protein K9H58_07125 [Bacteroidales bacterium]|nr:hypothetical protein [Bacteroidales bacterium]